MIVGLTGGIATGKSTVTQMLREMGAYVLDADVWARKVVEPQSEGLREIVDNFGTEVLMPDETLNRAALARIIFHNPSQRAVLNNITHPKIRSGMKRETVEFLKSHPGEPVVWDVPLLFEGETRHLVDAIVLVYASENIQLDRLMQRDGLNEAEARARIAAQMPIEEKKNLADYIVDNSQSIDYTKEQVQHLWQTLRLKAAEEYESSS